MCLFVFLEVKSDWLDSFWVKFLGSVQVPYHKGNDVLCAAMQKVLTSISYLHQNGAAFFRPSSCPSQYVIGP